VSTFKSDKFNVYLSKNLRISTVHSKNHNLEAKIDIHNYYELSTEYLRLIFIITYFFKYHLKHCLKWGIFKVTLQTTI